MIFELFKQGQATLKAAANKAEAEKAGVLRGGNSGVLFEKTGDHGGSCAAQTWLRFRGIDTSPLTQRAERESRELMFEAGRINEDAWYNTLINSGWKGTILREEEIPVTWTTDSGTRVTGRPDIVLVDEQGKPARGIELKLVSSLWTARTVLINRVPKFSHLVQAAHYMWQIGCPFELWYTNRTDFEAKSDFNLRSYPQYGEVESKHFTYRFYKLRADPVNGDFKQSAIDEHTYTKLRSLGEDVIAEVAKYKPFVQGFKLSFDSSGRLWYVDACRSDAEAKLTVITRDRIKAYYEMVASMKTVPKEPVTLKPDGKRESFKLSSYCSLGANCCKFRAGDELVEWEKDVKLQLDKVMQDK